MTLWVFIGIEGAVVVSSRAKNKKDVGKATVIGLIGTLIIYVLISLMSLGVQPRTEIAELANPSMAYILEFAVGKWGAVLINIGLIISLFGALLGWTLLAAEIPFVAAKDGVLPKIFAKQNKNGAPSASLIITAALIQLFLIITLFSEGTYQALFSFAGTAILLPYLLSALYGCKISYKGDTYDKEPKGRTKDIILATVATVYAIWLVYAAGIKYQLLCSLLYLIGLAFYIKAKKEHGNNEKIFKGYELILAILIVVGAIYAIYGLITGTVTI